MKILGYIITNNEWPIAGLSIIHALNYVADHVVVVNHNANKETTHNLQLLKSLANNKISIFNLDGPFFQETAAALFIGMFKDSYDWIYIFDSDEFGIVKSKYALKSNLSSVSKNTDAVRYMIDQYAVPNNMDERKVSEFLRINSKTIPTILNTQDYELLSKKIIEEKINLFDFQFPSKLIVRSKFFDKIGPGAHSILATKVREKKINKEFFSSAHLPYTSFNRFIKKSKHGESYVLQKYPKSHGWHWQCIYKIHKKNKLKKLWNKLTVNNHPSFNLEIDNTFRKKLKITVSKFIKIYSLVDKQAENKNNKYSYHNLLIALEEKKLLKKIIHENHERINYLENYIHEIHKSKYWKLTTLLRLLKEKLKI